MIGSAVFKHLCGSGLNVYGTSRKRIDSSRVFLDVTAKNFESELLFLPSKSFLINCIGLIRHKIGKEDEGLAWYLNSEYPRILAKHALHNNLKVINICTDCVFSGNSGDYSEDDAFDPIDLYGETKANGENNNAAVMNLRTSVVGPEVDSNFGLLSWVLSNEKDANLLGYQNHVWNGITSIALAKIVEGIINFDLFFPGKAHIVPKNQITKLDLIIEIAQRGGRDDLVVTPHNTEISVNRTLATKYPARNRKLWKSAGYLDLPSIQNLLSEVLAFREQK